MSDGGSPNAASGAAGTGYDSKSVEPEIYALWERGDGSRSYFHAEPDPSRPPFVITIPPPNVTGALHLGHALNNTLQDILIRRKRMQGFNVCWMPGTDHAGIATQAVVEKRLREEHGQSRHDVGREGLVKKIWEWKEEYNARILSQLRRMGCSCDWERTRFTLDEQCAKAVYETFFRFFRDGLIYRGLRLVNWDTQLQTAVADDEVYHETVRGSLWHIRYPIEGGIERLRDSGTNGGTSQRDRDSLNPSIPQSLNPYLIVATTRPETMLADTAVAVHPDDERYRHLIGQRVTLPLTGRTIPVIADGVLVKREFGTGCVKVTPGHDPNDYACWQRKLGQPDEIERRNMMTPDGKVHADNAGEGSAGVSPAQTGGRYAGLKLEEARKRIVADLEAAGLLEKVEPYETEVGHSDRSKTQIQPFLSEQWFVAMDKPGAPRLADMAMEAVRDGRVRFFPERYAKTYLDWLGEKRDWCISRQLWWGHRIPIWSKRLSMLHDDGSGSAHWISGQGADSWNWAKLRFSDRIGSVNLSEAELAATHIQVQPSEHDNAVWLHVCVPPNEKRIVGALQSAGFAQDPDVLDTWFSSALWPHSTFGWPDDDAVIQNPKSKIQNAPRAEADATRAEETPALPYFYPTSVLSTAREIITLWVARMVMTGLYNTGRVPFQHVYIHAVVQDGQGRPMKKSLGNGVDPVEIIDMYGADALRFTLAQLATETQDIRIPVKPLTLPDGRTVNTSERFELGRNFVTKLWQAANGFVIPTCRDVRIADRNPKSKTQNHTSRRPAAMPLFEKWIRVKLLACIREVDRRLEKYEFAPAIECLRTFFWNDLCDWYIEEVKSHLREGHASDDEKNDVKITLLQTFDIVLSLFHPAIPYVTEAIWRKIGEEIPRHHELIWPADRPLPDSAPALIVAPWPRVHEADRDAPDGSDAAWLSEVAAQTDAEREVDDFLAVIRALRDIRTWINGLRSQEKQPAIRTLSHASVRCDAATASRLERGIPTICRMGQVEAVAIGPDVPRPPESAAKVLPGIEVYVQLTGLADLAPARERLRKEQAEVAGVIAKIESTLANAGFVAKAPPAKIESERTRLAEFRERLTRIEANLADLGG